MRKSKRYIDIWNDRLSNDGDSPFIITTDRSMSYKYVWGRIKAIGDSLRKLGIKENMLVALYAEQDLPLTELILSLLYIGALAAPLNRHFNDKQISDLMEENPFRYLLSEKRIDSHIENMKIITFAEIFNSIKIDNKDEYVNKDAYKPATIIFSSGSTSQPKALVHSFSNHYFSAMGSNKNIRFSKGNLWLLSLPLYHIAGMSLLFRSLISASAIRIMDEKESIFDALEDEKITHVSLVEAQLVKLLAGKSLNNRMAELKAILVGGSAISQNLIEKALHLGWNIYTTYGSSEMCSQVTATSSKMLPKELCSSGGLLDYRELKIGESGEILLKGETLSAGYLQHGELHDIRDENGWFHSADLGEVDSRGLLYVRGRLDNMFISGGENIYPEFIEGVIKKLTDVEDALVVAVKDKKFGFRPALYIKTKDGHIPKIEELKHMLKGKIASFMMPDYIFPWLSESESGMIKIDRKKYSKKSQELIKSYGEGIEKK